ncbi:N-acetylglucosamine-6-phosphate deacetylase [Cyanobium sp. WAJ14-Wanaka]|uniref:N-acetylglucosamine-6-phosphate deacetylase n=1 Tax=Cyanobium sp. WAJ14-Wanaka TaxID=2823725 RepID=UPI0020CD0A46|nr:N-acetylglucosamine-6-phosphate deacetylase [Cyanobium sp. WAJ14-Wanaka]MCP9775360.1 N-acetylglucosamine-6-phosphate deacetylase [Cyanobium sp. WAJ14-Wanaka]
MRWLTNVRLPQAKRCSHGAQQLWRVGVDADGTISAVEPLPAGSVAAGIDWSGDWLSPAGVDLQINGGLGLAFPELTQADLPRLEELLETLWADGVEAICPTLVTCAVAPLRQALAVLAEARERHRPGRCQLLGAHLEGPFLEPSRRGAHPEAHLCAPSLEALAERIGGFEADIDLVTLAPELAGAAELIDALRSQGIVVSLGHSAANESQAEAAFAAGVGMVTHALNAMADMHRRAPGPVAAACLRDDVALGLIADGVHVAPSMALLLQRLAPGRLVLVSDALAPYGLADGEHRWDERVLLVHKGTCRLADGTLAGVTLPLLEGARRLAGWGCPAGQAIAAATLTPRQVLGDHRPAAEMLLGIPITETLRWHQDSSGLNWQRAAAAQKAAP